MTTYDEIRRLVDAAEQEYLQTVEELESSEANVAALQAELEKCQNPDPTPEPKPHKTLFGGTARAPGAGCPSKELDYIRGKTQPQVVDILNSEQAAMVGKTAPIWGIFHGYHSGMPTDFKQTEGAIVLTRGDMVAELNIKPNETELAAANSGLAAKFKQLVESCPRDRRTYLCILHEPSNNTDYNPARWRKAVAQGAKWVLQFRGDLDVVPTICVINWDLHPDNPKNHVGNDLQKPVDNHTAVQQNPAAELKAQGVPLDEVVYTTDGYTLAGKVASNPPTQLYGPTRALSRSWGFERFGVSEGSCKSQSTTDRANTEDWITDLQGFCIDEEVEFFCWYNSGVGPRSEPEGWYIYGDANKKAYAELCVS